MASGAWLPMQRSSRSREAGVREINSDGDTAKQRLDAGDLGAALWSLVSLADEDEAGGCTRDLVAGTA